MRCAMGNPLIEIHPSVIGGEQVNCVNARDLHAFLAVGKDFSDWIKAQVERARLVENRDYGVFSVPPERGAGNRGLRLEYALTIEAGKHIAMLSGTDKGFEVREYFLACEKQAHDPMHRLRTMPRSEMLLALAQEVKEKEELRAQTEAQRAAIQVMAPKAEFHDAVAVAEDGQSVGEVAKVLGLGQNRLFKWLYENNILMASSRMPYQEYLDRGYFRVIDQTPWTDSTGKKHIPTKTLVTGKGLIWLQAKVGKG